MGQVYSNGICNLCATAAEDSRMGLFFERNPLEVQPLLVTVPNKHQFEKLFLYNDGLWTTDVEQASLCKRGWVVQERILSKCNLHFGARELFWECRHQDACESFPAGHPEVKFTKSLKPFFSGFLSKQRSLLYSSQISPYSMITNDRVAKDGEKERMEIQVRQSIWNISVSKYNSLGEELERWNSILSTYTSCALTYRRDKLVAIGGLAKLTQQIIGGDYLAGLWGVALFYELLWFLKEPNGSAVEESQSGPSWSWVSVNAPVAKYCPKYDTAAARILNVRIQYETVDRFGQIREASITLQGRLAKAQVKKYPGERVDRLGDRSYLYVQNSWPQESRMNTMWAEFLEGKLRLDRVPKLAGLNLGDYFYLLPLTKTFQPTTQNDLYSTNGLILRWTGKHGIFRREGVFSTMGIDMGLFPPLPGDHGYFSGGVSNTIKHARVIENGCKTAYDEIKNNLAQAVGDKGDLMITII